MSFNSLPTNGFSFGFFGLVQHCVMPKEARYSWASRKFSLPLSFTKNVPDPNFSTVFFMATLALRLDGQNTMQTRASLLVGDTENVYSSPARQTGDASLTITIQ